MQHLLLDCLRQGFRLASGVEAAILVVGDLMLDRYLWGDVERISPEAPVPVVRLTRETERLGAAGNVAANLTGLGVRTFLVGFVGRDGDGERMIGMMEAAGIRVAGLVESQARPTIAKTRIIGGHQQMLRLDREVSGPYPAIDQEALLRKVLELLNEFSFDAVVLSDYAKGVLEGRICRDIITAARRLHVPIVVDPKGRDYSKYRGATTLTPNHREAAEACGVATDDIEGMLRGAARLVVDLELDFMTVTRGEDGISLIDGAGVHHLPAVAQQVFDVSGAGDTVVATVTAGLIAGLSPVQACTLANMAAGIVVGKVGTVPVTREELMHAIDVQVAVEQSDKITDIAVLSQRLDIWRARGERIAFTNGCFDLLHAGHVTFLERARQLGDRLIVGLNTDRSVRALKGPGRPVIGEDDRARVLAALESVNAVIMFDEETPTSLIRMLRPDVLVKGADYREDEVVGGEDVKCWGGRVELVELVPGRSTTGILNRLDA